MPFSQSLEIQNPSSSTSDVPFFIPDSHEVTVERNLTMEVTIRFKSKDEPKITWYRQRCMIKPSEKIEIKHIPDEQDGDYFAVLKIKHASEADDDEYQCKVSNSCGNSMAHIKLQWISFSRPSMISSPITEYLGSGQFRLTAEVLCPSFKTAIWKKFNSKGNETSINFTVGRITSDVEEFAPNQYRIHLSIHKISQHDRGFYRCEVIGATGQLSIDFPLVLTRISAECSPTFAHPPKMMLLPNESVLMIFWISSPEIPEFLWMLPDGTLPKLPTDEITMEVKEFSTDMAGKRRIFQVRTIVRKWFTAQHGNYTCIVQTEHGTLEVRYNISSSNEYLTNTLARHHINLPIESSLLPF